MLSFVGYFLVPGPLGGLKSVSGDVIEAISNLSAIKLSFVINMLNNENNFPAKYYGMFPK